MGLSPLAARTCFAVACFLGSTASAQEQTAAPAPALHSSFDHFWRRYVDATNASDADTADRMLEEIKRLRVERNVFELHDVAMSFAYRGFAYLEDGQHEDARSYFEIASELSPNLPTAYWGLASAAEREGGIGFLAAMVHRGRARLAAVRSERNGAYAVWNLAFLLFVALSIVVFVGALLMLYRYGVLFYHDLEERLGDRLEGKGVFAATLGLLFLPLILTMGIGWLAPYWLVLTFAYQNIRERITTGLVLVLMLAVAPFVELYAIWSRTVSNPVYQAALSSVTGSFDVDDVSVLYEAARQHPADRELQFLLAAQYKNLGDYELAAAQYREILAAFPNDLEAKINLGNIYFAQRDWDGALVQYNEALQSDSQSAMALYNKSLAHAENFQFAEREDARARADSVDAAAVSAHEKRTGSYRVVADHKLDDQQILAKFYGISDGMREVPVATFVDESLLRGWGFRFIVGSILLGVVAVALELVLRERRLTQRCWKCGSAFCGRCQIGTGRKGLCTQCYHLFFMKDGVSAQARNDKLAQVQRSSTKHALVFRLLSILAPGSGHISEGMPIVGGVLLFVWVLGGCAFLVGGTLYSVPDELFGMSSSLPYVLFVLMFVSFLMANLISRPLQRG